MDASEIKKGNYYRLDVEGYRRWYRENVPNGVFLFDPDDWLVRVSSAPELERLGEWSVGFDAINSPVGVGSAPKRFLSPITPDEHPTIAQVAERFGTREVEQDAK